MRNLHLPFLCGVATGFLLKEICCALACQPRRARHAPDIREAGRSQMKNPPRDWDIIDEQGDESFPASDPPGNY